jgi:hypothetical protein
MLPEIEQIPRGLDLSITCPNPISTAPTISKATISGLPGTRVSSCFATPNIDAVAPKLLDLDRLDHNPAFHAAIWESNRRTARH